MRLVPVASHELAGRRRYAVEIEKFHTSGRVTKPDVDSSHH
jgi:hypothetical protein